MLKATNAVAYVRMSTDRQETSPEQQRSEIESYADKNGYRIGHWYEDLGISGDRTDKRVQFQQMISDGSTGAFDVILCWDQSRFGRFDSIEFGRWVYPLRQSGVYLDTVADGKVDWHTMAGRISSAVTTEAKHSLLTQLSKDVSRAFSDLASEGRWIAGVPPFGYVRGSDGKLALGDPADVALVREIFQRYVGGETMKQIAVWLADRGIRSPKGKKWSTNGISHLLKNQRYLGHAISGQITGSKYRSDNPSGKMRKLPESSWKIVQNAHPPIIDQQTFDAAQSKRKRNTTKTSPNPADLPALSGLLRCGHCGYRMVGDKSNGPRTYICHSYHQRPGTCERYSVPEKETLRTVLAKLRSEYFDPIFGDENLSRLRQRMRELIEGDRPSIEIAKSQLAKVNAQIDRATERLVEVDPDMIPHVTKRIRELEAQRDALQPTVDQAAQSPRKQVTAVEKRIQAACDWLSRLEDLVDTDYDGPLVNRMLGQFVDRIELDMERVQWGSSGKRYRTEISGGRVYLRTANILPGDYLELSQSPGR